MIYMPFPFKRCSKCGYDFLPNKVFFPSRNGRLVAQCRQCAKDKSAQWQKDNPQKANEKNRNWRIKHADQTRLINQKYRDRHKEESRLYKRQYHQTEHGKSVRKAAKKTYKARKRGVEGTLTARDWQCCLEYFNGCCAVCERPPGLWHTIAADHWIPVTDPQCPGTTPTNIIPLCQGVNGCNNSKSNNDALTWLVSKFGEKQANQIANHIEAYFDWIKSNRE